MIKLYIYIIFFLSGFYILYSQNPDKQKLDYAKTFEQSGDYETSGRIFKELLEKNPNNRVYFEGVAKAYKNLSKYTELLDISREYIKQNKNVENLNLFAELLWRTGKTDSANLFWKKAVLAKADNPQTYIIIANTHIELQQYQKAVQILEEARENLDKDRLFADELCRMFIATGNYKRGSEEALNILYDTKNIALAQGRLSALLISKEANEYVRSTLEDAVSKYSSNQFLMKIYAWFLRTVGEFDKAFEIYKRIDDLLNSKGREVLNFANESRNDGQYDIALKAYEYVISLGKESRYLSSALYGYPRTLEEKMLSDTTISQETANRIINHYRNIIKEFPNNHSSADARYRIALIASGILRNNDMAVKEINALQSEFPGTALTATALNLLGNIYLIQDDINSAKSVYIKIISGYRKTAYEETLKAKYNLAEIEFFEGNLDSAQKLYAELSTLSSSDIANDALERMILLIQNKEQTKGMREFASALYYEKQNKLNEAIEKLKSIYQYTEGANLAELSLIKTAELYYKISKYDSSAYFSNKLISEYPKSIYQEKALLILGNSFTQLNKPEEAISSFNQILVNYPKSIYLQEARDKIRELKSINNL